jgi:hypothetical protein
VSGKNVNVTVTVLAVVRPVAVGHSVTLTSPGEEGGVMLRMILAIAAGPVPVTLVEITDTGTDP